MAVKVTCRRGHTTHRSEVNAEGSCEVCIWVDGAFNSAIELAALEAGRALGPTTEYGIHTASAILKLKR